MENELAVCKEHTGFCSEIRNVKETLKDLKNKWDSMQKIVFASLGALILNLFGIIYLILTKAP